MCSDTRPRLPIRLLQCLGIAFLLMLALVSLAPVFKGRIASGGQLHEAAHILAFCVAFLLNALTSKRPRELAIWGVALLLFGVILELSERSIYGNGLEYSDILDDAAGIAAGWILRKAVKG
jgi:hypothetical protein